MSKLIPTYIEQALRIEHLERELAEARGQLHLCNVDQFTTAAELAEATVKNSLTVQRPWVGLTGDEIEDLNKDQTLWEIIRAAEEILKEKNT